MPYCSVRFCGINNMTEDFRKHNITFHRFPNDPAIKLKWVLAIRQKKQSWYPSYASVVCSLHFKEECFQWRNKRKHLLKTAVPTERLFIPYIHRLQNLYTKCKTQSSKPGPKCNRREKPEADNVYDGKLMICKVYSYLDAEYKTLRDYYGEDCVLTPLSDILGRTAEATGVSKKTVTTVLKNEASFKLTLNRECQDSERLNEPAHEFARLTPASVPLPKVPKPKLPKPKAPSAIMPADVRKVNLSNKPPPPPVSLVLLAPVNNAHGVAITAENLLVQHDNSNEHNPAALFNMSSTPQVQATTNPMQLVLFTYDQTQQKDSAPNQCNYAISDTGVANITVESDLAELVLLNHVYPSKFRPKMVLIKEEVIDFTSDEQYKPEGFTATDDNTPYTCDVEIPAVKAEPESHGTYGINNNVQDFSDKTGEIKMNPADNEKEHMKVSLDNIIWQPAKPCTSLAMSSPTITRTLFNCMQ